MRARSWLIIVLLLIINVVSGIGCGLISTMQATPTHGPTRADALPIDAVKMDAAQDMYPPILHVDGWEQPVPVRGVANTAGGEDSAYIMPDGKTLYFFFTPDVSVPAEQQLLDGVTGIYVVQNVSGEWRDAKRIILQDQGKLALDGCEMIQGNSMWFCSAREGYTGVNLFTAQLIDGQWQNWEYTGDKLNLEYKIGEVHITANGQELYFHGLLEGGQGDVDIWVTRWLDGDWQTPENLQTVNSAELDGWPFLTADEGELWFTRMYQGTPAIYRSIRVDGNWTEPELIISQFAGEPSVDNADNIYFTHHYYIDGEMIEADIYVAYRE